SARKLLLLWLNKQVDLSNSQVRQHLTALRIFGDRYGSLISAVVSEIAIRAFYNAGSSRKHTHGRLSLAPGRKKRYRASWLTALWRFGRKTGSTFRSPSCLTGKCDCRQRRLRCTVRWSVTFSSALKRFKEKSATPKSPRAS